MQIELGSVLEGKVTGISNFGVFVSLPEGKSGMVHISEISSSYVKEITDFIKIGDVVKVKVINVDEKGKIGLSIKRVIEEQKENAALKKGNDAPCEYFSPNTNYNKKKVAVAKDANANDANNDFEEMLNKFKVDSDEKISDLKKVTDAKRGNAGYSRKNSNKY